MNALMSLTVISGLKYVKKNKETGQDIGQTNVSHKASL